MDFVVVGLGLGALAILSGIALLGVLAGRWARAAARATLPEDAAYGYAMAAGRRASGQDLLWAGGAILLATIGALAGSLDDRTGAMLVATTATVAALGILLRAYLYRVRNPLPRRPRPAKPIASPPATASRVMPLQGSLPTAVLALDEPEEVLAAANGVHEGVAARAEVIAPTLLDEQPSIVAPEPAAYSFMRDDSHEAGARNAPYSFMMDAAGDDDSAPSEDVPAASDDAPSEARQNVEAIPIAVEPDREPDSASSGQTGEDGDDLAEEERQRRS